jgi:thioredoxin-related protein
MKKYILMVLMSLAVMSSISCAGSKKETPKAAAGAVVWMAWDQAMTSAQEEGKFIVVDVYTDWCHWCKVMDEKTYVDPAVAGLMKESFVAVKLNAERENTVNFKGKAYTEMDLARNLGVNGYPTTMFLASDGTVIGKIPGYIEAPVFKQILEYLTSGSYKSMSLDQYMSGNK